MAPAQRALPDALGATRASARREPLKERYRQQNCGLRFGLSRLAVAVAAMAALLPDPERLGHLHGYVGVRRQQIKLAIFLRLHVPDHRSERGALIGWRDDVGTCLPNSLDRLLIGPLRVGEAAECCMPCLGKNCARALRA